MALTYNDVDAITNAYYVKTFPQLAFNKNIVMARLWKKGSKMTSGERIKVPVMYQHTQGGAYGEWDTFPVQGEERITAAYFGIVQYHADVTLTRLQLLKNDGPEGIKKLLDANWKLAAMKIADTMATDLWAKTSIDGSKYLTSLAIMADAAAGTYSGVTQYGNISRAAPNTWWGGNYISGAGATLNPNQHGLSRHMSTAWFTIADGDEHPTIIVMHPTMMDWYWQDARPEQRYIDQELLKQGWTAMQFNGVPLVGDRHLPAYSGTATANLIVYLNEDYIDFVSHSDENMRYEPMAKPTDQNVATGHIYWAGNVTCSAPKHSGLSSNFLVAWS